MNYEKPPIEQSKEPEEKGTSWAEKWGENGERKFLRKLTDYNILNFSRTKDPLLVRVETSGKTEIGRAVGIVEKNGEQNVVVEIPDGEGNITGETIPLKELQELNNNKEISQEEFALGLSLKKHLAEADRATNLMAQEIAKIPKYGSQTAKEQAPKARYENMSFTELERDPEYIDVLQEAALEYLKTVDKEWFYSEYNGERDSRGCLFKKDGSPSNHKPNNLIGSAGAPWVAEETKELLREKGLIDH